jgi:hypothetical protein
MESIVHPVTGGRIDFAAIDVDVSLLVGREIAVYSDQFPGKELRVKVVAAQERQVQVDSGGFGHIDNMVSNQTAVLQFPYKNQDVAVRALFRRTVGGRCSFILDEKVTPLSQRRFHRLRVNRSVKLAPFPLAVHSRRNLATLRWLETDSVNISSGGLMVNVPSYLERDVYLLLHIEWDDDTFPPLMLGRVRHCLGLDNGQFQIGIEFVIQEVGVKLFSTTRRRELPVSLFKYTRLQRDRVNQKFVSLQGEFDHN